MSAAAEIETGQVRVAIDGSERTHVELGGGVAIDARVIEWVRDVEQRGLRLSAERRGLRVVSPSPIAPADARFIRLHKPAIAAYLRHRRAGGAMAVLPGGYAASAPVVAWAMDLERRGIRVGAVIDLVGPLPAGTTERDRQYGHRHLDDVLTYLGATRDFGLVA
jgi:hypothetical protein